MPGISSSELTEPLLSDGSQKKTGCRKPLVLLTVIIVATALIAASTDKKNPQDQLSTKFHALDLAPLEIHDGSQRCSFSPSFSVAEKKQNNYGKR